MVSSIHSLFQDNSPELFWRITSHPTPTSEQWSRAIETAASLLPAQATSVGVDLATLLTQILGEGQFGNDHWRIGLVKRLYYNVKPVLPRALTRILRQLYRVPSEAAFLLNWPIEGRYAYFQWEVIRQLLQSTPDGVFQIIHFWPNAKRFAFVLTHDIETSQGQANVRMVAALEESLGFRSSFNFVPERYELDYELMQELRGRGFEIGVHGLKHDGKLFSTRDEFLNRVPLINQYLKKFDAVGFRAPLTHRNPEWMQDLDVEYDLSFFDTDPFEPVPGGSMSIWPFRIGKFMELPYTLVQDYTLTDVLRENSPKLWLQKVRFIKEYCGMALINTHPDYMNKSGTMRIYAAFLTEIRRVNDYWHALPFEVARWWQARAEARSYEALPGAVHSKIQISGAGVIISPESLQNRDQQPQMRM